MYIGIDPWHLHSLTTIPTVSLIHDIHRQLLYAPQMTPFILFYFITSVISDLSYYPLPS